MKRIVVFIATAFLVLACGAEQETTQTTPAEQPTQVTEPQAALPDVAAMGKIEIDPTVQGCLDFVTSEQWTQALSACLEAAKIEPGNTDVQAALDQARTQTAQASAETATQEAASKLGEAPTGVIK